MRLHLHKLTIALRGNDPRLEQAWRRLFEGWLEETSPETAALADLCLEVTLTDRLPSLPTETPYFRDSDSATARILSVYCAGEASALLYYHDGALFTVPLGAEARPQTEVISGYTLEQALNQGRFEDINFTTLAPSLRRRGYFLVHAFAASKNGRCVLIVGPSGSGKTTTGLSLLLQGWQLLANDVVLLERRPDGIYALPTPGDVGIRPQTLHLLPELQDKLGIEGIRPHPYTISGQRLVAGRWSMPLAVTSIITPRIEERTASQIQSQPRSVCFSHLMEESIDRWDTPTLPDHINILESVTKQATPYLLRLGSDLENLTTLLESA